MPAHLLAEDEAFFAEWKQFNGPMTRSRRRAAMLADAVGIDREPPIPVIGVVGSKGKGTTVAAATHRLRTLGCRVGTISSPPFLTNLERIRLNGEPISLADYAALADQLAAALATLPPPEETSGYMAPTGAFTLMGAHHLLQQNIDVLVIEEGLGGVTDEISQFRLDTLVVTPVFMEHEGVIGNTIEEIAANLVGAGDHRTQRIITPPEQNPAALAAMEQLLPQAPVITAAATEDLGFGPLTSANIATGYTAALAAQVQAASAEDIPPLELERAAALQLPGRSSILEHKGAPWFLDAAISREGFEAALEAVAGRPEFAGARYLVCLPDIKDIRRTIAVLDRDRTTLVRTHEDHLTFANYPSDWRQAGLQEALINAEVSGEPVVALGTMSFAAEMADHLKLDVAHWWKD